MAATHLDVGLRCIKYLLCAVNALFVLTGVMVIFVGSKALALFSDFNAFIVPNYLSPGALLIAVGVLIFVIAFFGCCGAIRESTCMVLVFAVSLSIVLVLEVAAAITAYALQGSVVEYFAPRMQWMIRSYGSNFEVTEAIDFLQSNLRCCGLFGADDWASLYSDDEPDPYPYSCCSWTTQLASLRHEKCEIPHLAGCGERLSMLIHRSALNLGTAAMAIALIQLTGIMFACTLGRAIRQQKTNRERQRWELRESLVSGYQPLGKTDPQTTFPVIYMQPEFATKTPIA